MFDLKADLISRFGTEQFRIDPDKALEGLFPAQLDSIDPNYRFRALYTTRRAGKSVSRIRNAIFLMLKFPSSRVIYGGLTQESAVNIGWGLFIEQCDLLGINYSTNLKNYKVSFPDYGGSSIQFFGFDSSEKNARRILGQGLRYVIVDEAGSITVNLHRIAFQFVRPALIDLAPYSYLDLISTPENLPNTYFSKVCLGNDPSFDWKIYTWTAFDNPHIADQWAEEINSIPEEYKLTFDYKCHYLGEFAINTDALIITFSPNNYLDMSHITTSDYVAVMGVDLGFNDATAITVGLYDPDKTNHLLIPFSKKQSGLDLEEAFNWIVQVQQRFSAVKVTIDGAAKQGVEYMRKRFPVPMEAADKKDKGIFLRALQADITMLRVLVDPNECLDLVEECSSAIWDEEKRAKGHYIEDQRCQVDALDSFLYLHRGASHYIYAPKEKKIEFDSKQYWDTYWDVKEEKLMDDNNMENILYGY